MPTSIASRTLARPVVSKNESTGECQSDAVISKNETTGNAIKTGFSNFDTCQKSQSDAVVSKNETIIINTTNETDKETINDTSSGAVQRTDEKKAKGDTGGFFEKIPPDPLKTFHCVQRAKKCSGFFCLA